MKWNKSTRYALYAAQEMALTNGELTSIATISEKYDISANHLAKVMQSLVRGGIAIGIRGIGGGYRLARDSRDITLQDVVEIFEGKTALDACVLKDGGIDCAGLSGCRLKQVFDEIEQKAYFTLKSITLATLIRGPIADGPPL